MNHKGYEAGVICVIEEWEVLKLALLEVSSFLWAPHGQNNFYSRDISQKRDDTYSLYISVPQMIVTTKPYVQNKIHSFAFSIEKHFF